MKLMLADDHPLFLEGLQFLLQTYGIEVVATALNGKDAIKKARQLKPDIILMDILMPECDGLEALKLIKAQMPDIKVIMLTTSDDNDDLYNAVKYGASGYLLKSTNANELVEMIHDVENGGATIQKDIAERILNDYDGDKKEDALLTERQRNILKLVANGATYKEAGKKLGITERTLKYHMGRIIEILHCENKAQVIAYAVKKGIINS